MFVLPPLRGFARPLLQLASVAGLSVLYLITKKHSLLGGTGV